MSDKPPALNPDGDKPAYKVKIFRLVRKKVC